MLQLSAKVLQLRSGLAAADGREQRKVVLPFMRTVKIVAHPDFRIGEIDRRLFGSFVEHLGRAVYGGIYEPGPSDSGRAGLSAGCYRAMVRELDVPIVRYPRRKFRIRIQLGGWCRPGCGSAAASGACVAHDRAESWSGTNEFVDWARKANTEVMMAVNLGTRGADEARQLVEYCNHPGGSALSDLRIAHGYTGAACDQDLVPRQRDGRAVANRLQRPRTNMGGWPCETAKVMKWVDPTIELVACGSSSSGHADVRRLGRNRISVTPTITSIVLSLHTYYGNRDENLPNFLARSVDMERFIKTITATCDHVKAKKRSKKTINLSFDEWNVWFHSNSADSKIEPWSIAPPQLEDVYTMEDALWSSA